MNEIMWHFKFDNKIKTRGTFSSTIHLWTTCLSWPLTQAIIFYRLLVQSIIDNIIKLNVFALSSAVNTNTLWCQEHTRTHCSNPPTCRCVLFPRLLSHDLFVFCSLVRHNILTSAHQAACVIYLCNNKSVKLWWSIRQRGASFQSATSPRYKGFSLLRQVNYTSISHDAYLYLVPIKEFLVPLPNKDDEHGKKTKHQHGNVATVPRCFLLTEQPSGCKPSVMFFYKSTETNSAKSQNKTSLTMYETKVLYIRFETVR